MSCDVPPKEQCSTENTSVLPESNESTTSSEVTHMEHSSIKELLPEPSKKNNTTLLSDVTQIKPSYEEAGKTSKEPGKCRLMTWETPTASTLQKDITKPKIQKRPKPTFKVPKLISDSKPIEDHDTAKQNREKKKDQKSNSDVKSCASESKPSFKTKTRSTRGEIEKNKKSSLQAPKPLDTNEEGIKKTRSKVKRTKPSSDEAAQTTLPKTAAKSPKNNKPRSRSNNKAVSVRSATVTSNTETYSKSDSNSITFSDANFQGCLLPMPNTGYFHPQLEDAKKRYLENLQEASTSNWSYKPDPNMGATSVGISKMNVNVEIDPNINDRYAEQIRLSAIYTGKNTDDPNESPEAKRKRIEKENMVVARQCRLHPANRSLNQGEVVNPPLMTPGVMVGYTPAGQRYECNLNCDRPTWFNSEYARCQFDHATKINACRMFKEIELGEFLPQALDPYAERVYLAERKLASKYAEEQFNPSGASVPSGRSRRGPQSWRHRLLDTERQLIEMNQFAVMTFMDFPLKLKQKIEDVTKLNLTRLMFLKNPCILGTIEKISQQTIFEELVAPAQILLMKIKGEFEVPETQTFNEYFASELEKFVEKVEDLSGVEIMFLVEEPTFPETCSRDLRKDSETVSNSAEPHMSANLANVSVQEETIQPADKVPNASDREWVPLTNSSGRGEYELTARARDINSDLSETSARRRITEENNGLLDEMRELRYLDLIMNGTRDGIEELERRVRMMIDSFETEYTGGMQNNLPFRFLTELEEGRGDEIELLNRLNEILEPRNESVLEVSHNDDMFEDISASLYDVIMWDLERSLLEEEDSEDEELIVVPLVIHLTINEYI